MNKILLTLCLLLTIVVVACTAPPEGVPAAVVNENDDNSGIETTQEAEDQLDQDVEIVDEVQEEQVEAIEDSEESLAGTSTVVIDTAASSFEFEGFAVGKSHTGTFDQWSGTLTSDGESIVGAEVVFEAATVNTGIGGLDNHLKAEDFFDVEQYPQIIILSTEITEDTASADLTFHGVTKNIQFPITQENGVLSADFLLDVSDFGMTNGGVNDEVRITFSVFGE